MDKICLCPSLCLLSCRKKRSFSEFSFSLPFQLFLLFQLVQVKHSSNTFQWWPLNKNMLINHRNINFFSNENDPLRRRFKGKLTSSISTRPYFLNLFFIFFCLVGFNVEWAPHALFAVWFSQTYLKTVPSRICSLWVSQNSERKFYLWEI